MADHDNSRRGWIEFRRRFFAACKAAGNEAKLAQARLTIMRARRAQASCCKETGGLAVSERLTFTDPETEAMCRRGAALLDAIKQESVKRASLKSSLSSLDAKAESAKIREIRRSIRGLSARLKLEYNKLSGIYQGLGERILANGELADRFAHQFNRQRATTELVAAAQSRLTTAEARRKELNIAIGFGFRKIAGAGLIALIGLLWMFWSSSLRSRNAMAAESGPSSATLDPKPAAPQGLSRDQLALSAELVSTHWIAWRDGHSSYWWHPLDDVEAGCSGSAGVVLADKNKIWLVTNRHVLMLKEICACKTSAIALKAYDMQVKFPSGQVRDVLKIAHVSGTLDIAFLQVDAANLVEGRDFVTLPKTTDTQIRVGDETVAVGNPAIDSVTFEGTQTFGHISAFQERQIEDGEGSCKWIQTDTAINPGNSGGPLFAKEGERYFWIGVNTAAIGRDQGYQGINLAIDAQQLSDCKFGWYDATKEGTAKALTELYDVATGVFTK